MTTVSAKQDSKQMYDLVKDNQQLERAWYGVQGNEWTRNMGVEVTSDVRDLLEKKCKINSYDVNFGDPAPGKQKTLVVESSNRKLQLRDWFREYYVNGLPFTCMGFERIAGEACYHHKSTDIKVWQDCLDLRNGATDFVVVFHYSDYIGFQNITAPEKEAAEIFASLHTQDTEDGQSANAWYGQGAYGTAKGPDDFHNEFVQNEAFFKKHGLKNAAEYIVDNNFRKMAQRDGFAQYVPKVKFCIPLLVARQNAYDVNRQQTPEMAQNNVSPGYNLRGAQMNVPGKPQRDQWVVRVDNDGTVQNARAALTSILQVRAQRGDFMSLARLAFVLDARGQKHEAADLYGQCYEARKNLYYSEHQDVLNAQSNYAYSLTQLTRYAEAEPIQKDNYERTKKKFGDKHRSTLLSLRNWAYTIMHLGHPDVAEPKFKEAYDKSKAAFGESDPDTMRNMGGWSLCLKELGQEDKSLQLKKQRYDDSKKKLGKNHPDTLTALGNYGVGLSQAGRNEEAETIKKEHYDLTKSLLGDKHPDTLSSMGNWAESLRKLGRREEALGYQRKRYELSCTVNGPQHESTLVAMTNLAVGLGRDSAEYEPLLRGVYEARLKQLGKDHPSTQRALKNWQTTQ